MALLSSRGDNQHVEEDQREGSQKPDNDYFILSLKLECLLPSAFLLSKSYSARLPQGQCLFC